jgi:hypothetical protein
MDQGWGEIVSFREVQRFRQPWIWALILPTSLLLVLLFSYGMVTQLFLGHPWGDKPMSDTMLAIFGSFMILLGLGLLYLFFYMELVTEVRNDGLYVRFFPFVRRTIPFDSIRRCEARTYRPIREYGGWGIRYGGKGKAYNVSGNQGVQLELSDGEKLLIGSQRAEELARAIEVEMRKRTPVN